MPITPLHASAFLFLYFKDKGRIDPLALVVSTTFIDLEPLYYILLGEPLDHRVWHGFTLALTIYPILVTVGVYLVERLFENMLLAIYKWAGLNPVKARYPLLNIYMLSLFGGFSHVFLDMFTHCEMSWLLYPFTYGNPFYSRQASIIVEATVIILSIYSLGCWLKSIGATRIGFSRNQKYIEGIQFRLFCNPKFDYERMHNSKKLYLAWTILLCLRVQCDER